MKKTVKKAYKELPFYGTSTEKPHTKRFNNIDILREYPFDDQKNRVPVPKKQ